MKLIYLPLALAALLSARAPAFASPCAYSFRNCLADSATTKYLGQRPICVMKAVCDRRCGEVPLGRGWATLYCEMISENSCMATSDCAGSETIKREEIVLLTDRPFPETKGGAAPGPTEGAK